MISDEQLQKALNDSLPSVLEGIKESFKNQAIREAQNKMSSLVAKTVEDFIAKEIIPEINLFLIENKDGMLGMVPKFSSELTTLIHDSMIKELKNKLENSWERQKIFESMFK